MGDELVEHRLGLHNVQDVIQHAFVLRGAPGRFGVLGDVGVAGQIKVLCVG